MVVTIVVPKNGHIHLVLVGFTAGWQANKSLGVLIFFKSYNLTSNPLFEYLNK